MALPAAVPGGARWLQASTTVKHLMLPCHWSQRTEVTSALVACYGALGSTIVFTETKRTADELASALGESLGARALHGDIPQTQREVRAWGLGGVQAWLGDVAAQPA